MRNAALTMGVLGGILAMIVGFFSFGYTEFVNWFGEIPDYIEQVENIDVIRTASFVTPILAIAGGAMARSSALLGGLLMIASAALFYAAFGFNVFTMFPLGFIGLGGVLALFARQPDAV